mmetsp:Transcript_93722/g.195453  ORF Transcript_93722/g.195453 Transcript_93722/m.195453 type:complete len:99 (+) Transcript_93722:180-476(+)
MSHAWTPTPNFHNWWPDIVRFEKAASSVPYQGTIRRPFLKRNTVLSCSFFVGLQAQASRLNHFSIVAFAANYMKLSGDLLLCSDVSELTEVSVYFVIF